MIVEELDEIYNMDITASLLVQPIQRNFGWTMDILLKNSDFEALEKYQEGIKFQI